MDPSQVLKAAVAETATTAGRREPVSAGPAGQTARAAGRGEAGGGGGRLRRGRVRKKQRSFILGLG